jgi:intein/homing endonuclease
MKIDGDMAEILGMHIGDGCISVNKRYSEYYLGGDITEEVEYHNNWVSKLFNKKIMLPLYGKEVTYKFHPKVGIYGFHIFDKKIVNFFNNLGIKSGPKLNVQIPKIILSDAYLIKRFLRGLFDTDGNIYFDKNRSAKNPINNCPIIKLGTVSEKLCNQVFNELLKLRFHPRKKNPYQGKRDKNKVHTVLIYRRGDIKKYIDEIGFKNPKHYTKWLIFKKLGFCPPNTNLKQRQELLKQKSL